MTIAVCGSSATSGPSETALRLPRSYRASAHRYAYRDSLLYYRAVADDTFRVVVPEDGDLRLRILFEYHDAFGGVAIVGVKNISHAESRLLLASPIQVRCQVRFGALWGHVNA